MSKVIEQAVKSKYGAVATSGLSTDHDGVRAVAEAFGRAAAWRDGHRGRGRLLISPAPP